MNGPRNVGYVKVSKDLQTILSSGPTSTGGYYSFTGDWTELENSGIQWLTSYTSKDETATKLKVMKIGKDYKYILMIFEIWSPDEYLKTVYKIVDKDGNDVDDGTPVEFCYGIRLMKADNPIPISEEKVLLV